MPRSHHSDPTTPDGPRGDSGYALMAALAVLLPLIGIAGAAMLAIGARNEVLMDEIRLEKALLAAEAGFDEARYQGATGALVSGTLISRTLPSGARFSVLPTHLLTDGIDNDGDTAIDEPDEDVFEVVASGTYRDAVRRIAAYIGRATMDLPVEAAIYTQDDTWKPKILNTSAVSGTDQNLDGSPGPEAPIFGIAVEPGDSTATILGNLDATEQLLVTGMGSAPSVGITTQVIDVDALTTMLWGMSPQLGLGGPLGDASINDYRLVWVQGDVDVTVPTSGAGILVFGTTKLDLDSTLQWDGIVIIMDGSDVHLHSGTLDVTGTVLMAPGAANDFDLDGSSNVMVQYCSEVIDAVETALLTSTSYKATLGWQEISRT